MHDLIVTNRQNEVLAEGVLERERDVPVVVTAIHRVSVDVLKRVVHPAHVPLEAVAESTALSGRRDATPAGRLLGCHDDARVVLVHRGVGLLHEVDRLEVFATAELIGQPLTVVAAVIEVQHGCHSVDAQTVDMELFDPEQGVGN